MDDLREEADGSITLKLRADKDLAVKIENLLIENKVQLHTGVSTLLDVVACQVAMHAGIDCEAFETTATLYIVGFKEFLKQRHKNVAHTNEVSAATH